MCPFEKKQALLCKHSMPRMSLILAEIHKGCLFQ